MISVAVKHDSILTTVKITNHSQFTLSGLFFSNFLPNYVKIKQETVQIDELYTTAYITEKGSENDVYEDKTSFRFVLDQPPDFTGIQIYPDQTILIKIQTDKPITDHIWHLVTYSKAERLPIWGYN